MTRYALNQIRDAWGDPPSHGAESSTHDGPFQIPEHIDQGDRHTTLYKFLRSQKARNVSLDVALAGCHALNEQQCEPPIAHAELDDYLRRVWPQQDDPTFQQARSQPAGPERLDDVPDDDENGKLKFKPFTDIERKVPEHLFGKRVYRGTPTLFVGEGAVGKGFVLAYIAARFTTGTPFVDALDSERQCTRPSNVAIMLTEDAEGISCALGFSWTLDCERVLAGGVSR